MQAPVTTHTDGIHGGIEGGIGGTALGIVLGGDGRGGAGGDGAVGAGTRRSRDSAVVSVNTVCAVLGTQLGRRVVGTLKLRGRLLCNLDLGDFAAAIITQTGDQNHVANRVGVQAVTKLQFIDVGGVGHTQIGREVGNGGSRLAADTPAPGDKRRAVRCIVGRVPLCIVGAGGIEHTAGVCRSGQVIIHRDTITNIFAGIDRLTIGHAVCITCVEGVLVTPAVHGLLADPGGVVHVVRTGYDVVLGSRRSLCFQGQRGTQSREKRGQSCHTQ